MSGRAALSGCGGKYKPACPHCGTLLWPGTDDGKTEQARREFIETERRSLDANNRVVVDKEPREGGAKQELKTVVIGAFELHFLYAACLLFLFAIVLLAGLYAIEGRPYAPPVVDEVVRNAFQKPEKSNS